MHIISKKKLKDYWEKHPDTMNPLIAWYRFVKKCDWKEPAHVALDFSQDVLRPDQRAVFDIKGGNYRLVVRIEYKISCVYIRFIGTHKEYDEIDILTI